MKVYYGAPRDIHLHLRCQIHCVSSLKTQGRATVSRRNLCGLRSCQRSSPSPSPVRRVASDLRTRTTSLSHPFSIARLQAPFRIGIPLPAEKDDPIRVGSPPAVLVDPRRGTGAMEQRRYHRAHQCSACGPTIWAQSTLGDQTRPSDPPSNRTYSWRSIRGVVRLCCKEAKRRLPRPDRHVAVTPRISDSCFGSIRWFPDFEASRQIECYAASRCIRPCAILSPLEEFCAHPSK
mmetsp:Transcript_18323/g.44975  ORF Transcript_18323/g.44975 Transcript_18323/m.44975 type:complete len:234 (+) Transcript_18323:1127-1828(+)